MEVVSFIILILLSLVGYSAGAVSRTSTSVQLKPKMIDLILISLIWAGAIYSKTVLDLNRWLIILVWLILSSLIGFLATLPRKLPKEKALSNKGARESSKNLIKEFWQVWRNFSERMGNFQSRIFLSFFFFVLVSPFALAVKIFSDPLQIKRRSNESHWLLKAKTEIDLEQFKRQF